MKLLLNLLLLGTLLICVPGKASAEFTICNESGDRVVVAGIVYEFTLLYGIGWAAGGWTPITHNQCEKVVRGFDRVQMYISIVNTETGALYMVEPGTRRDAYRSVEEFFCVSDDSFRRDMRPLDDHRQCAADEYLQLFNLYFDVTSRTNYTFTIR